MEESLEEKMKRNMEFEEKIVVRILSCKDGTMSGSVDTKLDENEAATCLAFALCSLAGLTPDEFPKGIDEIYNCLQKIRRERQARQLIRRDYAIN